MTMCSVVLLFGIAVILISARLALRGLDKDIILKAVVIPMTVMSAIFLVVAGYSDSQVAPAMGLLGTIIGYVLGSRAVDEGQPRDTKTQQPGGGRTEKPTDEIRA